MRLRKPPISIKKSSFQQAACNSFNINRLETINFNKFQYVLECGSGPGGRRFKSSLPDQSKSSENQGFSAHSQECDKTACGRVCGRCSFSGLPNARQRLAPPVDIWYLPHPTAQASANQSFSSLTPLGLCSALLPLRAVRLRMPLSYPKDTEPKPFASPTKH
jgi:hypothetical protein